MVKRPTNSAMSRGPEKPAGTALVSWEAELAEEAKLAAGIESNVGGGAWLSTQSCMLTLGDVQLAGNAIAVIVVSHLIENSYYDVPFDREAISPPKCFALGYDELKLTPHEAVTARNQEENDMCAGCPQNQYGTALRANGGRGKGKACGNRRRLALMIVGELSGSGNTVDLYQGQDGLVDVNYYATAQVLGLKVPPSSLKGWALYVKQLSSTLKCPPWAVFTKVSLIPDPRVQQRLVFSPLPQTGTMDSRVPVKLLPIIKDRIADAKRLIETPFNLEDDSEQEASPAVSAPRGKVAASGKRPKY